jgi:tungstate transport system ATP-binding protein
MNLYAVRKLQKEYNGRIVLDLPELTIEAGGMVALLGPNGAGKTTLLHILAFLLQPSSGQLWFKEKSVPFHSAGQHQLRRQVVLVEQQPILFSTSVAKNVAFGLKLRGLKRVEITRRVDESLEMVGMRGFARVNGRHLSGGETQRVAIARAIACRPEVILLDEPTSNVDIENRMAIETIMGDIRDAGRSSIIFCTHDLTQAARLTQSRLHLTAGRLNGADYENTFQAVVHRDGNQHWGCIGDRLRVPLPATSGAGARIAINPCRIRVASGDTSPPGPKSGHGRVTQMVEVGDGVRLLVDVGVPLAVILSLRDYRDLDPHIGDTVHVHCPLEALSLL